MIPALVPLILQASLQALFAAAAVWGGLRLLRVANVLVQKAAWGLVLVAALALPLVPHWQPLPGSAVFRLPAIAQDQLPTSTMASNSATTPTATPAPAEPSTPPRQHRAASQPVSTTPDGYDASSTSGGDLNAPVWSAPPTNSVTEGDPSSPAPVSESRPGVKGTGFSPYINSAKNSRALTPEGSDAEPPSIPNLSATSANTATPTHLLIRLAAFALLLYLGVFAALLLRLLFGLASALRIWITASPISGLPFDRIAGMRLRSSPRVASPVNIGSGIVLPADYADWDEEKLRIVVAHERSHVRQGDFYLQLLAGLYACLFWFSPLGWWLKRKLHELGEAISDRAGLEEAASRSSYAQLLLEFAALPRPTLTGVAMARTSHLSQRIERLLNESSFRQAFATGGRRALLSVLLVPVALFAATTLVRVEAATPTPAAQASLAGRSIPEQVTEPAPAPAPAPAQDAAPAPPPMPAPAPEPEAQPSAPPPPPGLTGEPGVAPVPPRTPNSAIGPMPPMTQTIGGMPPMQAFSDQFRTDHMRFHYGAFAYSEDGDPYALVQSDGKVTSPNGLFFRGEQAASEESIEKARKMANGAFLWFEHEGKPYIVDDPAIVAQIEAMNKPMDELGAQMRDLGKQMRDLGEQQRGIGEKMRDANVPTPDLSKEIADLNAAAAALKAKQGSTITQKDLSELQREIGRIQGQLGALQGRIGAQQGNFGGEMGKFGEQQGKLGGEMGKLGAQMGQIAHENQTKVKGIINDSLSNGKAKPVQ